MFSAPFDVTLAGESPGGKNVVQPDLVVSCDYNEKRDEKDRYRYSALVIESFAPNQERDCVRKLNVYMAGGVSEYWIVDLKEKGNPLSLRGKGTDGYVHLLPSRCSKINTFQGLEISTDDVFRSRNFIHDL